MVAEPVGEVLAEAVKREAVASAAVARWPTSPR